MTTPLIRLGSEAAFRLGEVVVSDDGASISGSMPTGPWLANQAGTPVAGSLGVLVDDILGYSLVRSRANGRWSVSSEITIDVVAPLDFAPSAGPLFATTIGPLRFDDLGGLVLGTVADSAGDVVVVCSQRGRWVPFDDEFLVQDPPDVDRSVTCLEQLLGGTPESVEGGAVLSLAVGPVLANPLGNMHGGISLCASDLTAAAAVTSWNQPWVTESLRIQYVRPIPAGATATFTAAVRHRGRSRAVVEVTSTVEGRACTFATITGRPALDPG